MNLSYFNQCLFVNIGNNQKPICTDTDEFVKLIWTHSRSIEQHCWQLMSDIDIEIREKCW